MSVKLLKEKEAAQYIGMSQSSLRQGRMNGPRTNKLPPPPFIRIGRAIRYDIVDLDKYIAEHRVDLMNQSVAKEDSKEQECHHGKR